MKGWVYTVIFIVVILLVGIIAGRQSKNTPVLKLEDQIVYIRECNDAYSLNENFFLSADTLTFKLRLVYFSNDDSTRLNEIAARTRIRALNQAYASTGLNIQFVVDKTLTINGQPKDADSKVFANIRRYKIEDYNLYNYYLFDPDYITIYIYHEDGRTDYAGVAGGVPSTFLGIREDFFFSTDIKTLEHELGHVFGLRHIHEPDPTDGLSIATGDRVCDTKAFISLLNKVDSTCTFKGNLDIVDDSEYFSRKDLAEHIHNIMSYSYFCRDRLTVGQLALMKWTVEQSQDLRKTLKNEIFRPSLNTTVFGDKLSESSGVSR